MNLQEEVHQLLRKIGPGHMINTAYDTAWIARLSERGERISALALDWLRESQLPDGSWGAPQPVYAHDRVISTLAAMNALARRSRAADRERLRHAETALEQYIGQLHMDLCGKTIGFEMIVPTLLYEAKSLGALHRDEMHIINKLLPLRASKMQLLPNKMISRFVTVAFSAEMAGLDGLSLLDVEHLLESDGSVSHSPSATAYFVLYVKRGDPTALAYLQKIAQDGGAPNVSRFDVFERGWVLFNLALTEPLDETSLNLCQPHLDFLETEWKAGHGVCWASGQEPPDGDDTAVTFQALQSFGRPRDLEAIMHYEMPFYFYCFPLESTPSVSANIHILGALRMAGLAVDHPMVQKITKFLQTVETKESFWYDKWHASPYYVTAHAIIAYTGYMDAMVESATEWILKTQNADGSWGYYALPTAEETACCLQALVIWMRQGKHVPQQVLKNGVQWLYDHAEPPYPPLWMGKCLYCPEMVVRSAILSALMLVDQG
ncbi:MAG: cyclase [Anaerolineae bacterium]|nr:cyclase [Anaerolineae bacterium]